MGLGAAGVVIPVLPTTPFVLLAAMPFSKGGSKAAQRLRENRIFGPYLENYYNKKGISVKRKIAAIIFVWTMLAISMIVLNTLPVCIVLPIIGAGVKIHLLMIKTRDDTEAAQSSQKKHLY